LNEKKRKKEKQQEEIAQILHLQKVNQLQCCTNLNSTSRHAAIKKMFHNGSLTHTR